MSSDEGQSPGRDGRAARGRTGGDAGGAGGDGGAEIRAGEGRAPDRLLDATGLKCPLPVLKARRVLRDMAVGEILEVRATDRAAPKDFRAFCDMTGDRLVASDTDAGVFVLRIAKAG